MLFNKDKFKLIVFADAQCSNIRFQCEDSVIINVSEAEHLGNLLGTKSNGNNVKLEAKAVCA